MDQSAAAMNRYGRYVRWLIVIGVGLAVIVGLTFRDQLTRDALDQWLVGLGPWAGFAFIAAYAAGAIAFLPGLVFTISAGALFGPIWGTVYSLVGATLGAALAFLAARYGFGDYAAQRTGERLARLQAGIDREGWRFVALMRLVPLVPFNLLNYALGLTRIGFWIYVATSLIAMLPGALAYVWVGHAGRQAISGGDRLVQNILIAVALVAALAFVPRLIRSIRGTRPGV